MYEKGTQTDSVDGASKQPEVNSSLGSGSTTGGAARGSRSPTVRSRRRSKIETSNSDLLRGGNNTNTTTGATGTSASTDNSSQSSTSSSSSPTNTTAVVAAIGEDAVFLDNARRILDPAELTAIEDSELFHSFLSTTSSVVERALSRADGFDPTVSYGSGSGDEDAKNREASEATVISVRDYYDERLCAGRAITDLAWSPHYKELFLTAMGARDLSHPNNHGSNSSSNYLDGRINDADSDGMVLVWSLNRHKTPEFKFTCQSPVTTAKFDPFSPNLIVGATFSGQVVLWDKRAKSQPVQRTPLSATGHTHPIFSLEVVGSANANKLVTISTDGRMCSWSLGSLSEPSDSTILSADNKSSDVAVTAMSFAAGDANEFCAGAENGCIYAAQVHGQKSGHLKRYEGHYGPVTSLMFHPGSNNSNNLGTIATNINDGSSSSSSGGSSSGGSSSSISGGGSGSGSGSGSSSVDQEDLNRTLSAMADHSGRAKSLLLSSSVDWTVRLWSHQPRDGQHPLREVASFRSARDYVYDVRWSPVHPSMFACVDGGGWLHVWDVNCDMEEPVVKMQVTEGGCAAVKVRFTRDGKGLIVGDSVGRVHYLMLKKETSSRASAWMQLSKLNQIRT